MTSLSCLSGELALQRVDLPQVTPDVMVAASLAGGQPEPAPRVRGARPFPAEMDQGGQVLLLLEGHRGEPLAGQHARHLAIQQRRGELHGVARYHPRIELIEPARVDIVPGAGLDPHVTVDAEPPRLREGRVRELEHADRARRRLIEREWIPGELPAPVRPRYRIAGALDLGDRPHELGGDEGGRMLAEERAVVPPCL